ncbi:Glutathione S-transferase F7 [Striga hermonthica]|uniref:glutathione transferase n=1 Tax=Striga hermonthica TaxID=68872 RepID=A0A9N7RL33_STRHE|nr:Glutathione S-transferase F7 [Striga hermonthica]
MAIKLYGHPLSVPTRRVALCLEEKGLQYEFVLVDLSTGQHKKEPFISINPFGQVPALEDGELKLFESRAITQYIARAYTNKGEPLVPNDPHEMAVVSVWTEVESQKFEVVASKLSYELVIKPKIGQVTDHGVVDQHQEKLAPLLDIYESRLSRSKYLGGDEFSLADLHHIPIVYYLLGTEIKALFDARPKVSAWCDDILGRPSWQKVVQAMKI